MESLLRDVIINFFEHCRAMSFAKEISIYQGVRPILDFDVIRCLKEAHDKDEILLELSSLSKLDNFKEFVLGQVEKESKEDINRWQREQLASKTDNDYRFYEIQIEKTKEYLSVLNWEWFIENNCHSLCEICNDAEDWRWGLIDNLFRYYLQVKYGRFLEYYKGCPLEKYLTNHGLENCIDDHYGLMKMDTLWVLKNGNPPKVFIPKLNTHVILRHIPSNLLGLIDEKRNTSDFKLSLRPDYHVCGDKIRDLQYICEERDFGRGYCGKLSKIENLSKFYDKDWINDWLIVRHNGEEITFEEILEDGPQDQDHFVTQVVHLMFKEIEGVEIITHIDHEYVFYDEAGIKAKKNKLLTKGEARDRYKTFKIDDAKIPFSLEVSNNLLYQVLISYFTKGDLVDEYFKG